MFAQMAAGVLGQQGAAVGGPFNPETDMTWHSLFWTEGTDFVAQGYTNTDPVGTWPNETSEFDVTGTITQRPTYTAASTGMNGKPSVDFNGTSNSLQGGAFTSSLTMPYTLVVIARDRGSTLNQYFTDCNDNSCIFNGLNISEYRWFPANTINTSGANRNSTDPRLFVAVANSASSFVEVDGGRTTGTSGTPTMSTGFTIGAFDGRNNFYGDFEASLVGLYSGDITADAKFADFESWVTSHYGITIA